MLEAPHQSWNQLVWLNGAVRPVSEASLADDAGLLRGDGLFETMLVSGGTPIAFDRHLDRLLASSRALLIDAPARASIVEASESLLHALRPNLPREATLRLTLTAASTLLQMRPLPPSTLERRNGLELWRFQEPRPDSLLSRHKSLAWTANAVHTRLHPRGGGPRFEGVWLAVDGAVLEGTSTNLFGVLGRGLSGTVITAPVSRPILPGVSRYRAIETLRALGIRVEERDFDWQTLESCSEAFATSATLPVSPVVSMEGEICSPGPVYERLRSALS